MRKKVLFSVFLISIIYICAVPVAISLASDNIGDSPPPAVDLGIDVTDGLVSMDVRDAMLCRVLQEIARKAKLELDISDNINGRVTISTKALPLDDVLKKLCENRAVVYQYIPEKKTCRIISAGAYSKGKSEKDITSSTDKSLLDPDIQDHDESLHSNKKTGTTSEKKLYDSRGRLLYKPGELLVRFKKDATEKQIADLHKSMGNAVAGGIARIRLQRVKLREGLSEQDAIKAYMASGIVEIAEKHALRYTNRTPDDPYFPDQWGLEKIQTPAAWDITTGSPEIIIAVIDTGVDYSHPDLANNIWVNSVELEGVVGVDDDENGYTDDIYGWDFADNDSEPVDMDSHGTHVAGIIAAEGNNGAGIAGVCWNAKIMVLKVQADGSDSMLNEDIIEAMYYAIDKGARIVNCSFGGESSMTAEYEAIEQLMETGIIDICAAGNDGANNDNTPEYPASYELGNIIAVAASNESDDLADFSNYGLTSVDVMAPGEGIKSTIPAISYTEASVIVNDIEYTAYGMAFAETTGAEGITGNFYNCLDGDPGDFPAGVSGNIALIERGSIYFSEKVSNAQTAGAIAVIIYNNDTSEFDNWTLGSPGDWPPVVCISREDGLTLTGMSTPQATVINLPGNALSFGNMSGTSMAAPHVAGIAGSILSKNPELDYSIVKSRILDTVDKIPSISDKLVSGGRVNAYAAVVAGLGDISGDGNIELDDAILSLQIAAGMHPNICDNCIELGADVNGDGRIGIEESIYVIQKISGLRE